MSDREGMTRREMLRECLLRGVGLGVAPGALAAFALAGRRRADAAVLKRHPAQFFDRLAHKRVKCVLCPKECEVGDRERGYCGVRENVGGEYYTLVWAEAAAVNVDPIEKKPLFHFLPGSTAFSIATVGCNMDCKDCQNWDISQTRPEQFENAIHLPPASVCAYAQRYRSPVIAYTYSEPVVFYEYMYDTAVEGRRRGLRSVMISNGYIQKEPMSKLLKTLDAVKIDLKGFRDDFYKTYCIGTLQPVLDTIRLVHESGVWLEIVYLVVPTLNDQPGPIREMCEWLVKTVGRDVPLHFSRFHPDYQLKNLPPTPYATLERCRRIAMEAGLRYVYLGNVPHSDAENTRCPKCKKVVVERNGYMVLSNKVRGGKCG
ncbi:MAG: AmmeMemoRadiSam system radical SAM enzyme, partial [Armatimonadota bacterium]